ncbi:hypothetical protein [Verrucomicrobium spinosum]|uniref:hypothetical protein n=1 Tax=Verrucomicrobium spinosum TaxID=2736 RepID=UPI000A5E94DC|nr:hypothetical protein [Verrucomicrobium spinosum]
MNNDVVAVELRNVLPMDNGHAVFLGNAEKTFVIFVDEPVAQPSPCRCVASSKTGLSPMTS